ncbi:hypothetical protein TWF481_001743 [Arthrobotrys musiformis]|uniref:Uncharacterized protein n=1 Tax=Arthrobotrys musiformis TaxID=47236 RepID=A0AAV9VUA8_9PEZI
MTTSQPTPKRDEEGFYVKENPHGDGTDSSKDRTEKLSFRLFLQFLLFVVVQTALTLTFEFWTDSWTNPNHLWTYFTIWAVAMTILIVGVDCRFMLVSRPPSWDEEYS